MNQEFAPIEFGRALKKFRKRDRTMTLARLAKEIMKVAGVRISPTALHYLERGRYKRSPARETIRGLARALNLSPSDAERLFELGGHSMVSESLVDRATDCIRSVLEIARGPDAEVFIEHLEATADRFARSLSARDEDVRSAVIPVAGWQMKLLAPEVVERMLIPALHEVAHTRIRDVVLIVAPGAASHWTLSKQFKGLELRTIEQDQPTGLARAILMGRRPGHLGPVAVLLPDEIDPRGEALSELVRQYELLRGPVIGVNPSPVEKERHEILRYYGIAVLKARSLAGKSPRVHGLEMPLIEKPREPRSFPPISRKIAGRYILTPEVFESIEMTGPELTAALNKHWKVIYAYELRKDLVALSPYQGIIDVIGSIEVGVV